jgi:hypothetical protein
MPFDFKKEYKELYQPKNKPEIITVPECTYISLTGKGDPNEKEGSYSNALQVLYAVAYTLRMSYKGSYKIKNFFEYVVPPLEGFWWQDNIKGVDYEHKESFNWISVIRLPDFITEKDFEWAVFEASKKKELDCSAAKYTTLHEGLCVQMLHVGPYDSEPKTVEIMNAYIEQHGYQNDFTSGRHHHEIYLSDPRKTDQSKLKTVIRHPIKKA